MKVTVAAGVWVYRFGGGVWANPSAIQGWVEQLLLWPQFKQPCAPSHSKYCHC